ncbi:beta family protein [Pseudomonas sp. UBA6310]|uniref:beta family protein n=1 Tax=Pseudomonas sp. UBA6310 TaxID=1947327 RepID=UPI00257D2C5A|nr:hypothetical protein [Pseudomonas sp. UBA6310]
MDFSKICYYPILKTKDAELRAIGNLDDLSFSQILPIYELTKSRITKSDSIGDIAKRLSQIREIQQNRPFILDVTTDPKQVNSQTESMLTPDNGYECWRIFLAAHSDLRIIPAIHVDFELDENLRETGALVRLASRVYPNLAIRIPPGLEDAEYEEVFNAITPYLGQARLHVLLDSGCIRKKFKSEGSLAGVNTLFAESIQSICRLRNASTWMQQLVCASGSFPAIVSSEGGDESGRFEILEHTLNQQLHQLFPFVKLGDYASINAQQTEMRAGTFVPRIDFCTNNDFYYHRFRRDKGGYIKCATEVLRNFNYQSLGTWGDEEITAAANGNPSGISPSFWISVRANRYMTSRVRLYAS